MNLPIHEWLMFMVNVGTYSSPMDGNRKTIEHGGLDYIDIGLVQKPVNRNISNISCCV